MPAAGKPAANTPASEALALHDQAKKAYAGGSYREAARLLEQAIQLDPQAAELYYNLGLIYEKLGELDTARTYFESSLSMEKDEGMRSRLQSVLKRIEGAKTEVQPEPAAEAAPVLPAPPPPPRETGWTDRSDFPWLVAGGTVTGLALVTGVGFGIAALSASPADDEQTGPGTTAMDLEDRASRAGALAMAADVSLGIAIVFGVATGLLAYHGADTSPAQAVAGSVRWTGTGISGKF